jgi:hypothetical protein
VANLGFLGHKLRDQPFQLKLAKLQPFMLITGTLTECGGKETENNFSSIFGQHSSDKLEKYLMKCNRVISLLDFRRRKATSSLASPGGWNVFLGLLPVLNIYDL